MSDLSLVSIDAETPLARVVDIAALDIAARSRGVANGGPPLPTEDVYALCAWGKLLNAVAKDHSKLFDDRLAKLSLPELEDYLAKHTVTQQAQAIATQRVEERKRVKKK